MRRRLRAQAVPLLALGTLACASSGGPPPGEAVPVFTRRWSPYTPEELNHDVIECADAAGKELAADPARWLESRDELRRSLFARTGTCMEWRGWQKIRRAG